MLVSDWKQIRLVFLPWLMSGDNELKRSSTSSPLALPVLRIGIHTLHEIERPRRIVKVAHLVRLVGDQLQQIERLRRLVELQVELPRQAWLVIANVASRQPAQVNIVVLDFLVLDQ